MYEYPAELGGPSISCADAINMGNNSVTRDVAPFNVPAIPVK